MNFIEFFAPGDPQPQGSKRAFFNKHLGRAMLLEDNQKLKPWRSVVTLKAQEAMQGAAPIEAPVKVEISFLFSRPKGHFGSGKNAASLKESAPAFKASKPDVDKLMRGILDSLTGVAFRDDSQVCVASGEKKYTVSAPGAYVRIWAI